ncbi:MAG: BatD family protein [Gammaproteobacteria bacterium]|nr:BatD family protein [Gammaproteobacteria bacterium]
MTVVQFRPPRRALLISLLLAGFSNAAVVTSLEPRLVDEMDTVRLTLRVTDRTKTETLDLAPLERDFEVLSNNTQSQYRSVNGRVEAWVQYQISLRPRRPGELVVPSIAIGDERSDAVKLIVRAMDPKIKQAIERLVFFETELSENPVYVQAETVLTRRLYYSNSVQIYSDLPGLPELSNAVVIPLGDTRSHTTVLDGQRYGVLEQQFAIFPEHSGTLVIPEISITSSVRLQSRGRVRRSGIRISTNEARLEVLRIPAEYPRDQPWLPASDVRIDETWSPGQASYALGEPLNRSLSVTAMGNTGSAIPPLGIGFSDEHFKWYPQAPSLDDDNTGSHIIGNRIEEYSLIPIKSGPAPLVEVAVTWWDTTAGQVRVAKLPHRLLRITGSEPARQPAPTDVEPTPTPPVRDPATDLADAPALTWSMSRALMLMAIVMIAIGVAMILVRIRRPGNDNLATDDTNAVAQARAGRSPKAAWSSLKYACRGNDLATIRTALVAFIEAHSAGSRVNALSRFKATDHNADLWRRLNEAVFGPSGSDAVSDAVSGAISGAVSGAEVLRAAAQLRKRPQKLAADPLPDLFS